MPEVLLNNEWSFTVPTGSSILDAGLKAGIALDYSCRSGRCGKCQAVVVSGETHLLQPEFLKLSQETILTCVRGTDIDIQLQADLRDLQQIHLVQLVPARINTLVFLNEHMLRVELRMPPQAKFTFSPGQYISISRVSLAKRHYSVLYSSQPNKLELLIAQVDAGLMSAYWFNQARVDDLLMLEGPYGTFCLQTKHPATKWLFIASGSGIAPIYALLQQLRKHPEPTGPIRLIWGVRHTRDLCLDLDGLVDEFIPVLSQPESSWTGRCGHVQDILQEMNDIEGAQAYVCGSLAMVQDVEHYLLSKPNIKVWSDIFVASGGTNL